MEPMTMDWQPLRGGPHEGKTIPEAFFSDPAFIVHAVEAGEFEGVLLDQAREVCRLAGRVRVPPDDDEDKDVAVFYSLLPDGNYSGHSVVSLRDPLLDQYAKCSAARTDNCLDLLMPMRIAPKDPWAPVAMVQALKYIILGDPNVPLTHRQAEGFFEDPEDFLEDK
jgi:hypothetical protein